MNERHSFKEISVLKSTILALKKSGGSDSTRKRFLYDSQLGKYLIDISQFIGVLNRRESFRPDIDTTRINACVCIYFARLECTCKETQFA